MNAITYVGLDVHKTTVCVAIAESGRGGEVREVGVFENRPDVLRKMVARIGKHRGRLNFCYEAGPCGYGLHRLLTGLGHDCVVVAPSLIPMKAGDRVKTDRRDALMLAKLHRAGELTPVPSEHSSGSTVRRAGITKAGNALARRVLIEGAWTYRMSARVSRKLHDRLEPLSAAIRDIAWKAQVRLCARYRRLVAIGKPKVVVTTAIAREMVGFIWAIARVAQPELI